MPRNSKKSGRPKSPEYVLYIFEIKRCEAIYGFGVNRLRYEEGAFNEMINLTVETVCTHPEQYAGRSTQFNIYGTQNCLEPEEYKKDKNWRDTSAAFLELPPSGGSCSVRPPIESMSFLQTAIIEKHVRFILLHGVPLVRGAAQCRAIEFMYSVD